MDIPTSLAYMLLSVTSGQVVEGPIVEHTYPTVQACVDKLSNPPIPTRAKDGKIKIWGCLPTKRNTDNDV